MNIKKVVRSISHGIKTKMTLSFFSKMETQTKMTLSFFSGLFFLCLAVLSGLWAIANSFNGGLWIGGNLELGKVCICTGCLLLGLGLLGLFRKVDPNPPPLWRC